MTVLGAGCVLGLSLLTWNTWFASRPGIVLKPETHYDFIIGKRINYFALQK